MRVDATGSAATLAGVEPRRLGLGGRIAGGARSTTRSCASPPSATTRPPGPHPRRSAQAEDATDVAVSPEGVVVVATADGLERVGDGPIVPEIEAACGIEFLDATRLAVAAGACGEDPRIRLADIESGATRALAGDKGEHFAFK